MRHEVKELKNGGGSEAQGLDSSDEDESKAGSATLNGNNGRTEEVNCLQIQPAPPQGPVVRWEKFLPFRSLKVLLVENDESTRNLVSALLRNCSYEVTAVANGFQAWKILEDLSNHVDLILSEVVMPIFSGVGLLSKIMSHKSNKNIPVIMMSSHDSMGLVFKCLSRGAVDFLVKPIRKNELKNLWQHVWRRCHSSSGSGSESGTQSRRSVKSNCNAESDNNAGCSDDEHDNGSDGLIIRDGNDNGSDTQSSWPKRAAEIESSQPTSPSNQWHSAPDSICAQVIHSKSEVCGNQHLCISEPKEYQEKHELNENVLVGKDLEIGDKKILDLDVEHHCKNSSTHQTSKRQNGLLEVDCKQLLQSDQIEQENESMTVKGLLSPKVISGTGNCKSHIAGCRYFKSPIRLSDISCVKNNPNYGSGEMSSLKLTLTRPRGDGPCQIATNCAQSILRHSDSSAFSKYHATSSSNQAPTGNVGSNSPPDNSSIAMKTEPTENFPSQANGVLPVPLSNGSSDNKDMNSTTKHVTPKPETSNDNFETLSAFKPFRSSAILPAQNGHISSPQEAIPQFPHDYCYHSVEKMHLQQSNTMTSVKSTAITAPQCGSSNVFEFEGLTEFNTVNGSASGSNGSCSAPNAKQTNLESNDEPAGNSEAGMISGVISRSGVDEHRVAQREAALIKFRQKRKERSFEKKVRYQGRKKLAEQRPRIKGQFL